jgi:putative spermidine/putrescine transport system ATP-binding protein
MTVGENVAYPLRVRGVGASQAATRVAAALATVNLDGFGDRRPAQLSGGQQQRVALARAMVFEPELILLDEPLGALDRQLRERMQIELKALHERLGVTMVYVTHDQSEALTMSDRIAVFAEGRIQQLATPFDLYESPSNAFVAGFIGESNRFEGKIVGRDGDRLAIETWGGRRVRATARDVPADATRVILSIRPERLLLDPGHRDNEFAFPLDSIVYLGDFSRLILALPDGGQLTVKANQPASHLGFRRGQDVGIGWNADDCHVFAV